MAENDVRNNEQQEDLSELIKVRRDKLRDLQDAGKDPFREVRFEKTAMSKEIVDNFEKYEGKTVSLAGRLVSKRVMGKASFAHILDGDGQIQLYFKRDVLGDEPYAEFKKYDIGDIIGVTGEVFVTHMGETTVNVTSVKLLSKSLLPLPEKFHGLTNTDLRYRQRYVDLIVNPEVKSVFVKRSMVLREIRNFLDEKGYLEVETPVLHNIAGGANARRSLRTTTRSISTCTFVSLWNFILNALSSAGSRKFTKSAEFSETKVWINAIIPSSRCWNFTRHIPTFTA